MRGEPGATPEISTSNPKEITMSQDGLKNTTSDKHACCAECNEVDEMKGTADDIATPKNPPAPFLGDLVWIVFWTIVLGSLLSAPHWIWVIDHWNDSRVPVPMGTVQSIHFIGDWGIDTQIDTEAHSLVVHGMTRFKKGSRVEQRKTWNSLQLCEVRVESTASHCEDLVRP
ncbi:MAG: hypothetical protein CFE44_11430 [Burkholderiales bacterium PBB4]|nr:MAG: hypothetical protein CFE44_11430 [Burkholderiales bacterium PBB4]